MVANGTMDQLGMKRFNKTATTTFLLSVRTEMTVTELRATVVNRTVKLCAASQN